MTKTPYSKRFDLEARTYDFAKRVRAFVKRLPRSMANAVDAKQLLRSSGSVGANYIEANESLSKKDFLLRIKICRKEAKEAGYWLRLLDLCSDPGIEKERSRLVQESTELVKIFNAIATKSK